MTFLSSAAGHGDAGSPLRHQLVLGLARTGAFVAGLVGFLAAATSLAG